MLSNAPYNLSQHKENRQSLLMAFLYAMQILLLQKELEGQTVVRSALEKALHCHPLLDDPMYKSLSQVAHIFLVYYYCESNSKFLLLWKKWLA